jgi:TonB family protein
VCGKSQKQAAENRDSSSLRACLVDGDAARLSGARRVRRRSLLLSVLVQISFLAARSHAFAFCLTCPPVLAASHPQSTSSEHANDNLTDADIIDGAGPECSECTGLTPNSGPHPAIPEIPTPSIVHLMHIDPAMLIHRVEPIFPVLARQTGREGRVELHALIGTDGVVRSLQTLEGDPMFYQSALDAVRQWRYKPLLLNGHPVEIDTHITVIYKLNR